MTFDFERAYMAKRMTQDMGHAMECLVGIDTESQLRKELGKANRTIHDLNAANQRLVNDYNSLLAEKQRLEAEVRKGNMNYKGAILNRDAQRAAMWEIIEKAPDLEQAGYAVGDLPYDQVVYLVSKHRLRMAEDRHLEEEVPERDYNRVRTLREGTAPIPACFHDVDFIPAVVESN